MEQKNFNLDFVKRTIAIIDQYDKYVMPNSSILDTEKYEITLMLNCFLGLLLFPKEKHFAKIPDCAINNLDSSWGISTCHIIKPGNDCIGRARKADKITLKEVVTDMRHSIAHILFTPYSEGGKIGGVVIATGRSKFKARLPIKELRIFLLKLGQQVMIAANETEGTSS